MNFAKIFILIFRKLDIQTVNFKQIRLTQSLLLARYI